MRLGLQRRQLPQSGLFGLRRVPQKHRAFVDSVLIGTDTLRPLFALTVKTMEVGMVMAQSFPKAPACKGWCRQRLVLQFANS